jgi:GNAT superfamily N-acetyltransferase
VFVSVADTTLVGVIALDDLGEPEIVHLWVEPGFRRRGVGRRLVDHAVAIARPMTRPLATVFSSHSSGRKMKKCRPCREGSALSLSSTAPSPGRGDQTGKEIY